MARRATVQRTTKESDVTVDLDLDGTGQVNVSTGVGFFDHMLEQLGKHGLFDLTIAAKGDLGIDAHHTVEDTGLALGTAFAQALGDRAGIVRFADTKTPLDEACIDVVLDLSGRPYLVYELEPPSALLGDFDPALAEEFYRAFATTAGMNLHLRQVSGRNGHHILEASFKGVARALAAATRIDPRKAGQVPSTKGVLTSA